MGVSYITCSKCNFSFPDSNQYEYCSNCGHDFCSQKCAKLQYDIPPEIMEEYKTLENIKAEFDMVEDFKHTCCICRKEYCTNDMLLSFLLTKYNLTKKEVIKLYKENI